MKALLAAASAAIAAVWPMHAVQAADAFPTKPIRLVVPVSAGGPADAAARLLATGMAASLGQPVVIDNRPGAGGRIGTAQAAKSPADGYTALVGLADTITLVPHVFKTQTYDALTDLDPVAGLAWVPLVLTARAKLPANNTGEVIALAKTEPGKISYGTWGVGSIAHLGGILLEQLSGAQLLHVPFPGGAPAQAQLLGNHIDLAFTSVQFADYESKVGALKILGLIGNRRTPLAPQMPTLEETGVKGYSVRQWFGIFVPAGTPAAVREKLSKAIQAYVSSAAGKAALNGAGLDPMAAGPGELGKVVKEDYQQWGQLIKTSGIRLD